MVNIKNHIMTRTGKIARLPRKLRDQLNQRLQDGESGQALVKWLNSLPEALSVLDAGFGARPINEQNLSDWKKGGYEDWLKQQERCSFVRSLAEESDDLEQSAGERTVNDHLSSILSAELASVASVMLAETKEPGERWKLMKEVLRESSQLRKEDHQAGRLRIERERWELDRQNGECEQNRLFEEEKERCIQKAQTAAEAPFWAALRRNSIAKAFGGGANGAKIAAIFDPIYPFPALGSLNKIVPASENGSDPSETQKPNPTASTSINPNQGESR